MTLLRHHLYGIKVINNYLSSDTSVRLLLALSILSPSANFLVMASSIFPKLLSANCVDIWDETCPSLCLQNLMLPNYQRETIMIATSDTFVQGVFLMKISNSRHTIRHLSESSTRSSDISDPYAYKHLLNKTGNKDIFFVYIFTNIKIR